jgi:hypothetical protein
MEECYIIEKFTRCPGCRSFSLKGLNPDESGGIPGISSENVFVCHNCGAQFALKGNSLKEIGSLAHQDKQEIPKREPVKIESTRMSSTAIFLVIFLGLIVGGILLLMQSWNPDQGQIEALEQKVESKQEANQKEEKKTNLEKAVIKETEETKEETQPIEPIKISQLEDEPGTDSGEIEPKSFKIFDDSGMKVRSSSPARSDQSLRWNFKRKTVTIKRSKTQRVYVAGGPTGKTKWAVDDEIVINGERIKGVSEEMTQSGYIPESNCLPPCDITHLVSADRETVLDIKLVDYGVFWGNTSLYIVVM